MLMWRTLPSASIVACLRSLVAKSKEPLERYESRASAPDTRRPAAKQERPTPPSGYSH